MKLFLSVFFISIQLCYGYDNYTNFKEKFNSIPSTVIIDEFTYETFISNILKYKVIGYYQILSLFKINQNPVFILKDTINCKFYAYGKYMRNSVENFVIIFYSKKDNKIQFYTANFDKTTNFVGINLISQNVDDLGEKNFTISLTNSNCIVYIQEPIKFTNNYKPVIQMSYIEDVTGIAGVRFSDSLALEDLSNCQSGKLIDIPFMSLKNIPKYEFNKKRFSHNLNLVPLKYFNNKIRGDVILTAIGNSEFGKNYTSYLIDCFRLRDNKYLILYMNKHKHEDYDFFYEINYQIISETNDLILNNNISYFGQKDKIIVSSFAHVKIEKSNLIISENNISKRFELQEDDAQ